MSVLVERRELLRAALLLGIAPLAQARSADGVRELVPDVLVEAARRLGDRCRAAGVVADEAALLAGYAGKSAQQLAAFLGARVRADFAADRLRAIGPWWLAETECRVLALL